MLAVLTHDDWQADGLGGLTSLAPMLVPLKRPDGSPIHEPHRPPLAAGAVKFVGDPVAFVVAETVDQARDAAELIEVDYEELPAVIETPDAVDPDAALVWPDLGDNVSFRQTMGDLEAVEAIFKAAAHVVSADLQIGRLAQNPMEPRAALGEYDAMADRYTLWTGTQGPHDNRNLLAQHTLKVPIARLRLVSPDMGGGFGLRGGLFPEMALVVWAAKKVGRPVKWNGDRSEHFLVDDHGRDSRPVAELALNEDGDFLAVRVKSVAALGAYCSFFGPLPTFGNMGAIVGMYKTGAASADVTAVFTNTCPIGPYRGAGRPEAIYICEMLVEKAAAELGFDRVELRRRNLIPESAMPYKTGLQYTYDCGRFEANMDKALAAAGYAGFEARPAGGRGPRPAARLRHDQRHRTIRRPGRRRRGNPLRRRRRRHADRRHLLPRPGARNRVQATAVRYAGRGVRAGALRPGRYRYRAPRPRHLRLALVGPGRRRDPAGERARDREGQVHRRAPFRDRRGGYRLRRRRLLGRRHRPLDPHRRDCRNGAQFLRRARRPRIGAGRERQLPPSRADLPDGTHCCEVEIDPETGVTELLNWVVVDDVGTVMNPMLLKGQFHGGIVQGAGQILLEGIAWDEAGQLVTGSFMDYALPRADDMPFIKVESSPTITKTNPLGIKGAGEAGCVGGLACTMIALLDAVRPAGVTALPMPASPHAVWQALQAAKAA